MFTEASLFDKIGKLEIALLSLNKTDVSVLFGVFNDDKICK